MSTIHEGNPTTILVAKNCYRTQKQGGWIPRGGKGLISVKLYPYDPDRGNPQPFVQADQGSMQIVRSGIASRAIKHTINEDTVVITCQDWSGRESLQNPIKRQFSLQFKTSVRADCFLEVWNELFEEYKVSQNATQDTTAAVGSSNGLSTVSKDAIHTEKGAAAVTTEITAVGPAFTSTNNVTHLGESMAANLNLAEEIPEENDGDNFDEDGDYGRYSYAHSYGDDDDLSEQTQPTTDFFRFDLKRK